MKIRNMVMILTVAVILSGCKKKEEAPAPPPEPNKTASVETQAEQTMCPVMDGMKINKDIFVEYKGHKVYFCCPDCKAKFLAEPEKYLAKLPQFKQ